jgi:sugar phosphate isomerase/epimerase
MNFDGLEILEMQMTDSSNSYIQQLKRRAHSQGLALCGFSTHQGFVSPDSTRRQDNIKKTIASIEQAYRLGIPTMRINTGRWGTIKSFDALMANRGIEPRLEGYTDDDAYKWVIQSIEECLPVAEKCGVVLGLENHWGLGRTAAGVLEIIGAIKSPWLQATLDTGNFLEDMYQQMEALAPAACFVQAKTYNGGGTWYTLDIDYPQVATILHDAGYRGWVSLEFEGKDDPLIAIPKNLELLRHAFDRQ